MIQHLSPPQAITYFRKKLYFGCLAGLYTSALTQSQWMFSSDFNVDFEQVLAIPHPVFTCSKLKIETLEKGVKYV